MDIKKIEHIPEIENLKIKGAEEIEDSKREEDAKKIEIVPNQGVVTILDILGWKGIWQRNKNALQDLDDLVNEIETFASSSSKLFRNFQKFGVEDNITKVMVISDTIVITTSAEENDSNNALDLHGLICKDAIPYSIMKGIPVRGATCYGEFATGKGINSFVGKAVDEAASWHETTDWIGVIMTPSAKYSYHTPTEDYWKETDPPFKNNLKFSTYGVNWINQEDLSLQEILKAFINLSPIIPDIVNKFENTIKFITPEKSATHKKNILPE